MQWTLKYLLNERRKGETLMALDHEGKEDKGLLEEELRLRLEKPKDF